MFKYEGNTLKKKLQGDVLKNLYNSCIYEPMRVKAIQDVLAQIIKRDFMNVFLKHLKDEFLEKSVSDANKAHQIVAITSRKYQEDLRMIITSQLSK